MNTSVTLPTPATPFHPGETVRRGFLAGLASAGPAAILLAVFVLPSVALLVQSGVGSNLMLEVPTDLATALLARHLLLRMGRDREPLAHALKNGVRDLFRALPAIIAAGLVQVALLALLVMGVLWMGGSLLTLGTGALFSHGDAPTHAAASAGMATGGLVVAIAAGVGLLAAKALFFTLVPIIVLERIPFFAAVRRSARLVRRRFSVLFGVFMALAAVDAITVTFESLVPVLSPAGVFLRALIHAGAVVATWVSLREAGGEGDLFDFVREVGGTPHGEQAYVEAQRTEWATAQLATLDASGVPSYREPAPLSVADDALLNAARARERRMKRVRQGVFALAGVMLFIGAVSAVASRVGAARERKDLLATLGKAGAERETDLAVGRAMSLYGEDLYGMKAGDDGDLGGTIRNLLSDDEHAINVLRKDLIAIDCSDAAQTALGRRSATQFFDTCTPAEALRLKYAPASGAAMHADAPGLRAEPKLANAVVATVLAHRAEKRHTDSEDMHAAIIGALLR